MKKKILFVFILVAGFGSASCALLPRPPQVCFAGRCVNVELADDPEKLEHGLRERTSLASGHGMLFIFPQTEPRFFWMKDTWISLDIIWLDENKKIVHVEDNVPPCVSESCPVFGPAAPVRYVLEINAGAAAGLGIKPGDQAEFNEERKLFGIPIGK